jgi:hypothetical protein
MSIATQLDSEAATQLREICQAIAARQLSLAQWEAVESSDEFQTGRIEGGFEAAEGAFTFSYFEVGGGEWWFDLTLERALAVASGESVNLELRKPQ